MGEGNRLVVHGETPGIRDTKGLAPHTPTPKQCSKPVAVRPVDSCTFRSTKLAAVRPVCEAGPAVIRGIALVGQCPYFEIV